jgi:hypothetical protein
MFNPEKTENPPSFPELTEEDLWEIRKMRSELDKALGDYIRGFEAYTGVNEIVGQHSVFNGPITAGQLKYALAMTRSPILRELIENGGRRGEIDASVLVENKIMAGMKMLDLGSGPEPVLARCCRSTGADAWTADVYPIA